MHACFFLIFRPNRLFLRLEIIDAHERQGKDEDRSYVGFVMWAKPRSSSRPKHGYKKKKKHERQSPQRSALDVDVRLITVDDQSFHVNNYKHRVKLHNISIYLGQT